jgi:hypothetical protein
VSEAAARRGITAIVKALGDDGPMTRAQLRAVLERADLPTARQAIVHVLFRATLDGLIIRGPMIGREHAFVLVTDCLGERPKIDRDRALAELARRYLAAHGPAQDRDLAKWAQLPLRDARAGLATIASELDYRADGLVDLPRNDLVALPPPRLLGPFDPLLSQKARLGSCGRSLAHVQWGDRIRGNAVAPLPAVGAMVVAERSCAVAGARPRSVASTARRLLIRQWSQGI